MRVEPSDANRDNKTPDRDRQWAGKPYQHTSSNTTSDKHSFDFPFEKITCVFSSKLPSIRLSDNDHTSSGSPHTLFGLYAYFISLLFRKT
jgi:hypothetical protein|tara:strand:- start:16913 stop:17182 length:270 start_codon:yes stop_codon:yes gene_type:complete